MPKTDGGNVSSCPRCLTNLVRGRYGELIAHGCPRCGGIWLDQATNDSIVAGLTDEAMAVLRDRSAKTKAKVDLEAEGLTCPVCHEALRRHRVKHAWLDIDICDAHGTWYDCGEIERVAQAMGSPEPSDWRPPQAADGDVAEESPDVYRRRLERQLESMRAVTMAATARAEAIDARRRYGDDW